MTTEHASPIRRVAVWLVKRTYRALPSQRREWADAMLGELPHIDDDGQALRWAFGCWIASHVERIRVSPVVELLPVRLAVMWLLIWHVFNDLFATVLKLAYKTQHVGVAEQLGRLTPHGDYRPFIPLMDAIPVWLHAIWVGAAVAYGMSAVRYLRRSSSPLVPFAFAFMLEIVAWVQLQPFERSTGVTGGRTISLLFCLASVLPWVALRKRGAAPQDATSLR